jgi:glucan phosphoethanolaminetransferase (alkaline phosphatase superfamily)
MDSTGLLKSLAIFKARIVLGTYLLLSIAWIVCRETPILSANSDWVIFRMALCILMVLVMASLFKGYYDKASIENGSEISWAW